MRYIPSISAFASYPTPRLLLLFKLPLSLKTFGGKQKVEKGEIENWKIGENWNFFGNFDFVKKATQRQAPS